VERLRPGDVQLLDIESASTPMHLATVEVFDPPEEGFDYRRLVSLVGDRLAFVPRYRQRLATVPGHLARPAWVDDDDFDLTYHVRQSAVPRPGSMEQVQDLVARIITRPLDRTRPLWEYSIIEGLQSGEFALYCKIHHALIDGVAAMKLLQSSLTKDPDARNIPLPWSLAAARDGRRVRAERPGVLDIIKAQLEGIPAVARALGRTAALTGQPADGRMAIPFEAPRSPLNVRVTGARRAPPARTDVRRSRHRDTTDAAACRNPYRRRPRDRA